MTAKTLICVGLALIGSLCLGYLNTHTDELMVVIPAVVLVAGTLSLIQPRGAWAWALLAGLPIPLSQLIAVIAGIHVPYANSLGDIATSGVALVPAAIAAGMGAAVGWTMQQLVTPPPDTL